MNIREKNIWVESVLLTIGDTKTIQTLRCINSMNRLHGDSCEACQVIDSFQDSLYDSNRLMSDLYAIL